MKTAIWILAADCSRARVFEAGETDRQLYQLKDFVNRNGGRNPRVNNCDANATGDASASPVSGEKHPALRFAQQLGEYLDKARREQRFDGLYVIAPHQFLGVLRAVLPAAVRKLVAEEIDQRLSASRVDEIEAHMRSRLPLADH